MKRFVRAIAAGSVLGLGLSANADLLYDNGAPDHVNGSEMTGFIQAEDFDANGTGALTDVRFWSLEDAANSPYQGSILWWILSDDAGQPDAALHEGSVVPTRVATGVTVSTLSEYQYDFSIGALTLPAGTYWLALHNGATTYTEFVGFFWETTDSTIAKPHHYGQEAGAPFPDPFDATLLYWQESGTWAVDPGTNNEYFVPFEHAFQLYGVVPEPSAILSGSVLALAAGLAVARKRKA